MTASNTRAGQRRSSIFSAASTCLIRRSWSSVSRIVKLELSPTSSAWRRNMRAAIAWNVPSHTPSAAPPIIASSRSRISRAALLVKVTASNSPGNARRVARICASRVVNTRVLPVPAPASTSTGPSTACTARACASFRTARYGAVSGARDAAARIWHRPHHIATRTPPGHQGSRRYKLRGASRPHCGRAGRASGRIAIIRMRQCAASCATSGFLYDCHRLIRNYGQCTRRSSFLS